LPNPTGDDDPNPVDKLLFGIVCALDGKEGFYFSCFLDNTIMTVAPFKLNAPAFSLSPNTFPL